MGNSYFQFKHFIINQEKCAMKVCTDTCLFGAFISAEEKNSSAEDTNILDIGTGTGLLSLMIAQKVKGNIEAVEIDAKAFEQAQENFKNSLWNERLSIHHADILQLQLNKKYNIIVSNPPFFERYLRGTSFQKNIAKHSNHLPHADLASIVFNNLTDKGKFYILLPFYEFEVFERTAAEKKLFLIEKLEIRQNVTSNYFRTVGIFSKTKSKSSFTIKSLTIKDSFNAYTQEFIELLKEYYLYLL